MANIAIIDGNYRDGETAVTRSNDNVQVQSCVGSRDSNGNPIYLPHVKAAGPNTAFGELQVESKTPQVQIRYPYNIVHPDIGQSLTNKSGSTVTASDGQAIVTCSSTAESFSQIRTLDTLRYGPGQGAEMLGTCVFTTGVANSSQVFGPGDDDEGFFFGYNGADFGILHRYGGSLEIKSLEITGAATGTGTITITMDGTAVPIEVTSGDSIATVTRKIVAEATAFGNAGRGWEVHTDDNVSIEFISLVAETAGGAFSFVDTDTTGVTAGAFSTEVVGVAPTEDWVAQTSWNVDVMDGTGPSGVTLDPTKGNVFKVSFQYLGYGAITYEIENPSTGAFQVVHILEWANANTTPTMRDPTLHLTLIAKTESGYTGGALTMKTASMAGFIQGIESSKGIRRSISVEKSISTTETPLLILYNELDFNSLKNKVSAYPDFTSFATESTKPTTLRLYREPTEITGATALTDIETNVSVMQYSSTGTAVVGGERVLTFIMSGNGGGSRNLKDLEIQIRPGERYVLTAQIASGNNSLVNASYTWIERI